MEPLVSVIIPAYNCEDYIIETLESIRIQTYKNYEVIIVNDGSSDNTKSIIDKYIQNYSKIKINQIVTKNKGVSSARNVGISASRGEYIAFLDSDDLWEPNKLEEQILEINKSNFDACYCGYYKWFYEKDIKTKVDIVFHRDEILQYYLKAITWPQTSTWLIKRDLIHKHNLSFNENICWGEDFDFFAKVISFARVCCVENYLVLYRLRENSLSIFNKNHLASVDIWSNLNDWLDRNYKFYSEEIRNIIFKQRIPSEVMFIMSKIIKNYSKYKEYLSEDRILLYLKILKNYNIKKGVKKKIKRYIFIIFLEVKAIYLK